MQNQPASLFRQPVPIDPLRHATAGLIPQAGFEFAASLTLIPLGIEELAPASAHVPILFGGEGGCPQGLYGIRPDHNLFVGSDGRWRPTCYIPLTVRHYPFHVQNVVGGPQLTIDEAAEMFRAEGGAPLFENGDVSSLHRAAFDACLESAADLDRAADFTLALQDYGLLKPCDLHMMLADGERIHLAGHYQLDGASLEVLSDSGVLDLRRRGFLKPLYAVLLSQERWDGLMQLGGVAARGI
ncbi:SapC family protein [Lacibacterium aquatile]|uniref:SapC family protein n=1 Tax=Lacibacterium aquatile TaxID=1168082 RepID=A0ABW5DQC9_9PROT